MLNTCPLTWSPTGTEIADPVSVTGAPRTRPSAGCMAIARTVLSPRCCAISSVIVLRSASKSTSTVSALKSCGTWPRGNSTSTTGPVTCTTRPMAASGTESSVVDFSAVLMSVITPHGGQRLGATDDLADLLGDLSLAGPVGLTSEVFNQLGCVVGGSLHRLAAAGLPRSRRPPKRRGNPGFVCFLQQVAE